MKLWPQTLMGRTLTVVLAGIALSIFITIGQQLLDRSVLLATIGGWHGVERLSDSIIKVEAADPANRAALAKSFETPGFRAAWGPDSVLPAKELDWQGQQVRTVLEKFLGEVAPGALRIALVNYREASRAVPHARMNEWRKRVERHGGPDMMAHMLRDRDEARTLGGPSGDEPSLRPLVLLISYQLTDGSWLTFVTPPAPPPPFWGTRFFFLSMMMLLVLIGTTVWAVRRSTRPLGRFALAAQRLGLNVNAPPMDEEGPREVRRAAQAFNRMQHRLQAFVKDRTHMLAAISHDLRTPITRLRLRAEFIEDDEQRLKMLGDLEEMEAMIASTLQFARDDAVGEPNKVLDLAALVRGLCTDAVQAGDEVVFSGPESLMFDGREVALKRMVANLIGNAVRYGERARVTLGICEDEVCLTVSDDGPGIAEDMMERVFDPFVRVEGSRSRETGGVGLGLTAVKTIVQAHGGHIDLMNRPQSEGRGGLDVRVCLPQGLA